MKLTSIFEALLSMSRYWYKAAALSAQVCSHSVEDTLRFAAGSSPHPDPVMRVFEVLYPLVKICQGCSSMSRMAVFCRSEDSKALEDAPQ